MIKLYQNQSFQRGPGRHLRDYKPKTILSVAKPGKSKDELRPKNPSQWGQQNRALARRNKLNQID